MILSVDGDCSDGSCWSFQCAELVGVGMVVDTGWYFRPFDLHDVLVCSVMDGDVVRTVSTCDRHRPMGLQNERNTVLSDDYPVDRNDICGGSYTTQQHDPLAGSGSSGCWPVNTGIGFGLLEGVNTGQRSDDRGRRHMWGWWHVVYVWIFDDWVDSVVARVPPER